jgi:hypothetical protein
MAANCPEVKAASWVALMDVNCLELKPSICVVVKAATWVVDKEVTIAPTCSAVKPPI